MSTQTPMRIGILWRGSPEPREVVELGRFGPVFSALNQRGLEPEAVLFTDDGADEVRKQLLGLGGVLVWVDPIADGRDRSLLDPLLRDVASRGVWVSAHPDVILKMGTKDVLVKTRRMDWGSDCYLYATGEEMAEQLPLRLATGPRVLKQHRGNGGNGVWKVELLGQPGVVGPEARVSVLHAQRESTLEEMRLAEFIDRCAMYFTGSGCMIDQPYQARLRDGMIRCYLVGDRVAGFGHQFVTALLPPPDGAIQRPPPPPRLYYGPSKSEFQVLKAKLESEWVREMQRLLDIETDSLPALWDADLLYGPKDASGEDTYVLCEIKRQLRLPVPG
jgi:hypothetical protein